MMSRPSTLPMKLTPGAPSQQVVGLLDQRVALRRLLADRQQPDPWAGRCRSGAAANTAPICANCTSHSGWHSALAPASSRTVGGRARHGDRRGDGRAGHALDAAHAQQRAGHGGAGVAGADHRRRLAVAHRLGGAHQRRVLLARARPARRVVVHGDDLGRRRSSRSAASATTSGGPTRTTGIAELVGGRARAGDDLVGGLVAAHGVDGDRQHED